jgi:hypothetical protein
MTNLELHNLARDNANQAVEAYITENGETQYCGYAYVKIKGNTSFYRDLKKQGLTSRDPYRGMMVDDILDTNTQSLDVKEAGVEAYADTLKENGLYAFAGSYAL